MGETTIMPKKALIFVPHQDDEIGTAGVIIKRLVELQAEVYVCYATNGDFEMAAEIRLNEAAEALKVLGVSRDHIMILGYPDTSNENMFEHIFYYDAEKSIKSRAEYTETYGAGGFEDYIYDITGKHHKYTKKNYTEDIKKVIKQLEPDFLVCVDMDHHVDHRMLSLVFDKVMGEILKEKTDYQPVIWKAFAYGTNFSALRDYREMNLESTKFPNTRLANNEGRLDNPFYNWEKRVRVPSEREWYKAPIEESIFYKALNCHKSQKATMFAESTINSDQVFWERRSDNLMLHGKIEASSGNALCLNDFMLFDAKEIHDVEKIKMCGLWKPEKGDNEKQLTLMLDSRYKVSSISIWGIGTSVKVKLEYEGKEAWQSIDSLYGEICLNVPENLEVDKLQLSFEYDATKEFGIGEVEVFEDKRVETKYIKLLSDNNMLDVYFTWLYRPRISLYQYCQYNLKNDEEVLFWINGKEVPAFSHVPWKVFLANRKIKIKACIKNAPYLQDEMEIVRLHFAEWLRKRKG